MRRNNKLSLSPALRIALQTVLILALLASSCAASFADASLMNNPELPRIVDDAGIFTSEDKDDIQTAIDKLLSYGMDFAVYTTDSSRGKTDMALADDFYDENGYGAGESFSGCVLCICMEENNRFWWLSACGDAEKYFTEYNINYLDDEMYIFMVNGSYGPGVYNYLQYVQQLYEYGPDVWEEKQYPSGNGGYSYSDEYWNEDSGFSVDSKEKLLDALAFGGGFGLVAGAISLITAINGMKSVKKASRAVNYLDRKSFNLSIARDIFLYRSETKTRIQTQQNNSHGHPGGHSGYSGGHHSSSGRHHSGGGRHF